MLPPGLRHIPYVCGKRTSAVIPAVLWTPANDPLLVAWWNAQDTAKMTFSGNNLLTWLDETGVHTFTSATAPTYNTASIGGLTVLNYAPGAAMSSDTLTHPQNWIALAIIQPANVAQTPTFLNADNNSTVRQAQYLRTASGPTTATIAFNTAPTPFTATGPTVIVNGTSYVIDGMSTGAAVSHAINGTVGTPVAETGTMAALSIAMNLPSGTYTGLIGDVVLSGSSSTSVRQKYEGYMAWKYGLQGSLPGGFPYKNRPPFVGDP